MSAPTPSQSSTPEQQSTTDVTNSMSNTQNNTSKPGNIYFLLHTYIHK